MSRCTFHSYKDLCLGTSLVLGRVGWSGRVVVTCCSYDLEVLGVMVLELDLLLLVILVV